MKHAPIGLGFAKILLWTAATVSSLVIAYQVVAQTPILEGSKLYTPTRLEWLALTLEANDRVVVDETTLYSMDFVPIEKENAIRIFVRYYPTVDRAILNGSIETARKLITSYSQAYKWTSWLKTQEDVQMILKK